MRSNLICTLLLLVFTSFLTVKAQDEGKIRGFVNDKKSDAAIPFANVVLKGTNIGAVANENGFFILNNVPVGKYTLQVSFVGYKTYTASVEVTTDKITNVKAFLEESSEVLQDVEITADRQERETKVLTGVVSINPKQIQQFSVGGDADIIKAIQVLPGVVTTGDQGGQLYIRGGAPIQNLILLDGMVVYNPFHSIGFFSVFDADIIKSADVYTGGFNAEYGSRNSAVMDIQTRDGNRKRLAGKVSASTYSSKLLLETPLGIKNERGQAATSFLVSAKTSYLDQSSKVFYPYIHTEYDGLPFSFTDIYGKLTSQSDNGSKVNGFGFSFSDDVRFNGGNSVNWDAAGAGVDFTAVPSTSSVLLNGNFSYSDYNIAAVTDGSDNPSTSGISSFNGGLDFTYFIRQNDEFRYGFQVIGYHTQLSLYNSFGLKTTNDDNSTELGGYFRYKYYSEHLIIEPGIRLQYYGTQSELSLEPRLGLKYNINEWLRLKASGGLYSQNLMAANSDRDVVNLFYGFLSSPDDYPSKFRGEPVTSTLQKARHVVAGVEVEATKNLTINLEGYIKDFNQIFNVNRNQLYSSSNPDPTIPEIYKTQFIVEKGLARGIDLLAKYRTSKLYLWLAYSLGKVTRDDGIREYYPYFDRRHNLNFVGTYSFGEDLSWEVSLRYNFGTGFPFTPTAAFYDQLTFLNNQNSGDISYDYTTQNGQLGTLYGDLNTKRLPNYHRVDVSVQKEFKIKDHQKVEISAGATNVLNYDNIFYYDRVDNKRVNQLPIMPTVSISYSF